MIEMRRRIIIEVIIGLVGGYYGNLIAGGIGRSYNALLLGLFVAFLSSFLVYYYFGIKINHWFVNILAALGAGLLAGYLGGPVALSIILGVVASLLIRPVSHRLFAPVAVYISESPRGAIIIALISFLALMAPILIWANSRDILKEVSIVLAVIISPIALIIFTRLVDAYRKN